ncbi:hypothetical protein BAE44_0016098 [Dichanthelium oligosanthes]|uniref:Uncharacterized protein n=1 Tax=Dichanthelium oligosanthes TaxID=888268 RepID=A0A1E5VCK3_9POAL|nr:hypothetical protein BAE44_0016098 [Dichanthelium oligosanthes]
MQCAYTQVQEERHPIWSLQLTSCSNCQNKLFYCSSTSLHVRFTSQFGCSNT